MSPFTFDTTVGGCIAVMFAPERMTIVLFKAYIHSNTAEDAVLYFSNTIFKLYFLCVLFCFVLFLYRSMRHGYIISAVFINLDEPASAVILEMTASHSHSSSFSAIMTLQRKDVQQGEK